ncbi:unnamed protein product [Bursaphelenchus okinawaensis]|uniref:Nuclear receptor domain-containing protein n=1 Tax=Bursaphelenchus okinawaensis TaxID=465554 RepID=A0A811L1T5_9BILA|nr:unnamed protein product [Bursaphelenchus okinawaensis]CAG9114666.1 unnamed protein product [Bursaphelenchus okinawaensis]
MATALAVSFSKQRRGTVGGRLRRQNATGRFNEELNQCVDDMEENSESTGRFVRHSSRLAKRSGQFSTKSAGRPKGEVDPTLKRARRSARHATTSNQNFLESTESSEYSTSISTHPEAAASSSDYVSNQHLQYQPSGHFSDQKTRIGRSSVTSTDAQDISTESSINSSQCSQVSVQYDELEEGYSRLNEGNLENSGNFDVDLVGFRGKSGLLLGENGVLKSKNGQLLCIICGRDGAGKHYGIQSCLGCKTFFRRAVIHNRRYFCDNNLECDAREKKSRGPCAACRLHRCFMAGMTKEALKGKRDIIPLKPKTRSKRQSSNEENVTPSPVQTPIEVNIPLDLNNLIDPLTELDYRTRENKLQRFDSMTRARKLSCDLTDNYPPFAYFTGLRIVDTVELAALASVEMYAMVEWADGLSFFHNLSVSHRAAALRRYSVYQLVIETGYCTAVSQYDDVWMMPNGTCMPRDVAFLPEESQKIVNPDRAWRQEKLYNQMTNSCIDDVAMPMRRLNILPQELATLKVIVFCQSCNFVCRELFESGCDVQSSLGYIEEFKDKVIKDLFCFYQISRMENYEERFGNLLLIVSGIVSTATFLRESYQVMRVFGIVLFDNFTEKLLFSAESDGFVL